MVDPETGAVDDLGRIATEARSPAWWQANGSWHLAYLAMPEPFGGDAVYDIAVPASAAGHHDLTAGMASSPADLVQVADDPPLALFAEGLDTAIYRLDPGLRRFRRLSARDGLVDSLTVNRSGEVVAALVSTSYEPKNVHAGPPGGPLIQLTALGQFGSALCRVLTPALGRFASRSFATLTGRNGVRSELPAWLQGSP